MLPREKVWIIVVILNDADAIADIAHRGMLKCTISLVAEPFFPQYSADRRHVMISGFEQSACGKLIVDDDALNLIGARDLVEVW
jgi:hypothetical protein